MAIFPNQSSHDPIPEKCRTPYGGRLTWKLGSTELVVHLKDKNRIRHKKRWSQCMYMYYLIMHKLLNNGNVELSDDVECDIATKSDFIKRLDSDKQKKLANTYILALDGDVDFKPNAVRFLVNSMIKDKHTGAACGRIHPVGKGPMVWYQVFEYAVGHWFQKATEHIIGCVLCSPGCFSLFRTSALLDNNVMRTYLSVATEATDFIQYDMGEDRWLCTLLLQQGHRVEYIAASDAYTFAPVSFDEFFKQRKRWTPSTLANIIDLLGNYEATVAQNKNISKLYIFYQFILLISTVLGPSTIIIAIASAFQSILKWDVWICFILSFAPCLFYIVICLTTKLKTQIQVAQFLATAYSCVMLIVLVSIIKSFNDENLLSPSLMFIVIVSAAFVVGGFLHPQEIGALAYGPMYFLFIPAGYLLLNIFSICNLNDINWGTRETIIIKTDEEKRKEAEEKNKKKWYNLLSLNKIIKDIADIFAPLLKKREDELLREQLLLSTLQMLNRDVKKLHKTIENIAQKKKTGENEDKDDILENLEAPVKIFKDQLEEKNRKIQGEEKKDEIEDVIEKPDSSKTITIENENWKTALWYDEIKYGKNGDCENEEQFWNQLIEKYLKPFEKDEKKEKEGKVALKELRNSVCFGYWFCNILWVLLNFMLMTDKKLTFDVFEARTPALGLVFMGIFTFILSIQMIGMFLHRWETFIDVVAEVEIIKKKPDENNIDGTISTEISYQNNAYETINEAKRNHKKYKQNGRQYAQPNPYDLV